MKSLNPPSFHASASSALKSVRATAFGAATSLFGLNPLNVDRRTRSGDGVALQLPRLLKLDLHGNRLAEVPPLGGVPLLVLANKMDLAAAAPVASTDACFALHIS